VLFVVLFLLVAIHLLLSLEVGLCNIWSNLVELLDWEDSEEFPSLVEGVEDVSGLVGSLGKESSFVLFQELQEEQVIRRQGFLTNNGLHSEGILTHGVEGVKLVGHTWVIFSGQLVAIVFNTNGRLHESGEGWEHINWWVDLFVVQVSVNENLTLSDISGQIWDWMGDIVIRHGKARNLGNRSVRSLDSTSSLVNGGQIGIHVTWITSSTWDFFSGSRNFSQSISIRRHIGKKGKYVNFFFVSQVLGGSKSKSWSNNSLNGWIIGKVHEEADSVHGSVHLEIGLEESSNFHSYSHSGEDNTHVLIGVIMNILMLYEGSLSGNLSSNFIMWQTGS
jgi:hypothetical protein